MKPYVVGPLDGIVSNGSSLIEKYWELAERGCTVNRQNRMAC